jgi:hypothetical protein
MKRLTTWHRLRRLQEQTGKVETRKSRRARGVAGFALVSLVAALGASQAVAQTGCPNPNPQPDPYPDCTYPTPNTLQMFDQLELGSFAFSASDELVSNSYSGMPFQHVIWDFELYNDQGKFYLVSNAMRSDPTPSTLVAFPWLGQAFQEGPTGGLINDPRYKPWGGLGTQIQVGDKLVYSTTTANGLEQITDGPDTFEYTTANGDIYLKGTRSGNGTTWELPWKEPSGATNTFLYNIEGYHVEGTWHGEHVTGHVVNENMWATVPYFTAWWVQNRIGSWSFFSTEYKDGTSESGQFLCGEYGFRGAIVTNRAGKSTVKTTAINTYDEPYGYRIELGNGEEFKFVDNAGASSGTPFHFGQVYRTQDKNKVKSGDAVGFTFGRECTPKNLHRKDQEDQQ